MYLYLTESMHSYREHACIQIPWACAELGCHQITPHTHKLTYHIYLRDWEHACIYSQPALAELGCHGSWDCSEDDWEECFHAQPRCDPFMRVRYVCMYTHVKCRFFLCGQLCWLCIYTYTYIHQCSITPSGVYCCTGCIYAHEYKCQDIYVCIHV